jgi:hypothetical protein
MHPGKDAHADQHGMPGLYSIGTLARLSGVTRHVMLRLLRESRVRFMRAGRAIYVPMTELQKKLPAFWETMKTLLKEEAARREPPDRRATARRRLFRPTRL